MQHECKIAKCFISYFFPSYFWYSFRNFWINFGKNFQMIEVHAEILRGPGSPVYLTGEDIECEITFKSVNELNEQKNQQKSLVKTLAWACAQISCQCYLNESRIILPKTKTSQQQASVMFVNNTNNVLNKVDMSDTLENQKTSFLPNKGENGIVVYTSKPKILFCDLKLDQNNSKSCKTLFFFNDSRNFRWSK